ncbi:MAG: tRNA (adenosine(37)-N6)-dimethylallyltransferase MiaA [Acidimicrobiales bacterium]
MAAVPIVLVGTTASGKSAVSYRLARSCGNLEIVSADSMSVYRSMDIGTAKPTAQERSTVRHHLIDIVDPSQEFTVAKFQGCGNEVLDDLAARDVEGIIVGGTGLYVRALVDGLSIPGRYPEVVAALEIEHGEDTGALYRRLADLDPEAAEKITVQNRRRILRALEVTVGSGRPFSSFGPGLRAHPPTAFRMFGIRFDAQSVDRRIEERLSQQIEAGFLDEVRHLASWPGGLSRTARQALGYKELLLHLSGELPLLDALALILQRTRALARRQWSWFRRDPRIHWLDRDEVTLALERELNPIGITRRIRARD